MTTRSTKARFGPFVFDPDSGELTSGKTSTRLQRQPALVLGVLLNRAGDVVTRDELKAEIWPDTVVEFDQGLNYCIRQIRAALADSADEPVYIETLARRGYRFMASVAWVESGQKRNNLARHAFATALAIVAALAWFSASGSRQREAASDARAPIRLAILPLREQVPGMMLSETLVTELTNADGAFDVLGPATTARFSADPRTEPEIGAELGVAYIISGGIRNADSALFVQVIRVADSAHVFARLIPFTFAYQDSSLHRLAQDLSAQLTSMHANVARPVGLSQADR